MRRSRQLFTPPMLEVRTVAPDLIAPHPELTKSDTEQHLQFLRCLLKYSPSSSIKTHRSWVHEPNPKKYISIAVAIRSLGRIEAWHSETNEDIRRCLYWDWFVKIDIVHSGLFSFFPKNFKRTSFTADWILTLHIHCFIIRGQVKWGQSRVLWNKSWWHWGWEIWWICRSRWWKGRERWRWSILILSCIQWVAGCTGLCMSGLA